MTAAEIFIMAGLLIALCIVLVWMTLRARYDKAHEPAGNPGDRQQIIEMPAGIKDQSTLSALLSRPPRTLLLPA